MTHRSMRRVFQRAQDRHTLIAALLKSCMGCFVDVPNPIHRGSDAGDHSRRILVREMYLGVSNGELCRSNGELRKATTVLCSPRVHELFRNEVSDLRGHLTRIIGSVECADVVDRGLAGDEV